MDNLIEWPFANTGLYIWHIDFPDYETRMRWITGNATWYAKQ